MALIKKRPKIGLLIQDAVHPGRSFNAKVLLDARRAVPIRCLEVLLRGKESAHFGGGANQTTKHREFLVLGARLSGPRTLEAGTHPFPVRFDLPADIPPTFDGSRGKTSYELHVRAVIPWWPDRRERYNIRVTLPPQLLGRADKPLRFTSSPDGPKGKKAYLEGSLSTTTIAPGSSISGAVALGNVEFNRYSGVFLELFAVETVDSRWRSARTELWRYEVKVPVDKRQLEDGRPFPFVFRVPPQLAPSFKSTLWELRWYLKVRAVVRWGSDLVIQLPVDIIARPRALADGPPPEVSAPPLVGTPRLMAIWHAVAADTGMVVEEEEARMRGQAHDAEIEIRREHRGRLGLFVIGELRYPSLHLSIKMDPHRGLLTLLSGGISLGDLEWDRKHQIVGRNEPQIRRFLDELLGALRPFGKAQMNDERIIVKYRGSGQRQRPLSKFAGNLMVLAREVSAARAAIPPPSGPGLEWDIPAWRGLAERLQGELEPARMAVTGSFDGIRAQVETVWSEDGSALHTLVELGLLTPLPMDNEVCLSRETGDLDNLTDHVSVRPEARELLRRVAEDALFLDLKPERLAIGLPAPMKDPTPLCDRLSGLAHLVHALRHGEGPYR
jgi:hypothetical protein